MMTRKHFEAVAAILRDTGASTVQEPTEHEKGRQFQSAVIAGRLAGYFATENENFDRERFMKAFSL